MSRVNKMLTGAVIVLLVGAAVLASLGISQLLAAHGSGISGASRVYQSSPNPIPAENQLPGSANWVLTHESGRGEIQAYTSADSVSPGQSLTLYVSTTAPAFTIEVFRLGYYQGLGARQVYAVQHVPGTSQGYYPNSGDPVSAPVNCPTCTLDPATHEVSANWVANSPLDTIIFGAKWVSGLYFIRVTTETALPRQWGVPVVLRDDTAHADVIMSLPFNTYQAYNYWGGSSLYHDYTSSPLAVKHAYAVSYNRPYVLGGGSQYLFFWSLQMVMFLEGEGVNIRYTTDNALDKGYTPLGNYFAFVVAGHSEYWSYNMRQALTAAIVKDKISVGFFSANSIYWQVRMSADGRTVTCYKDQLPSVHNDPYDQPGNPKRYLTTTLWRWAPVNQPEDLILKEMYGLTTKDAGSDSSVAQNLILTNTSAWAFAHTGLKNGAVIHKALATEVDVIAHDNSWGSNDDVTVLAQSPYTDLYGAKFTQGTTLDDIKVNGVLTHQMIFDAGAIDWSVIMLTSSPDGVALREITWNVLYGMVHRTTNPPAIPVRDIIDNYAPTVSAPSGE